MNFQIAVPSFNRAILFGRKTYRLIKASEAEAYTTVFVVAEQVEEYRKLYPDITFVVGLKGVVNQRKFIFDYYPQGTQVVSIDDDIDYLYTIQKERVLDIRPTAQRGFEGCVKNQCRLWGVYPVANHYFMKAEDTTSLKFCIGCLYGYIKQGDYVISPHPQKEDIYQSCVYYRADKKVFRMNDISVKTQFLRGDSLEASKQQHEEGANKIMEEFPLWAKKYYRKNGFPEVRLQARASSSN